MENPAPFDLNHALQQWRASLQNLGGFSADELEELEGHLRESISVLHARGLSAQEAFTIATRRLGSERQLSDEFAKANPQRIWTERAMWMVVGVLVAYMVRVVFAPFPNTITMSALQLGLNGHLVGASVFLDGWFLWPVAAAISYWIFGRHSSWRDRVVEAAIRSPVLIGVGLFLGLVYLQHLMPDVDRLVSQKLHVVGGLTVAPNPKTLAILNSWCFWKNFLAPLFWIAAGPLLAGYAWRNRQKPVSGSPISYDMQPGEQEAARVFESQGLSLEEAGLVLKWRRGPQELVAPSLGLATNRSIWLERAVWMVTGVAFSDCLARLVLEPASLVAAATRATAPLLQHLGGLVSVCLGPALAGAVIAALWSWITRHPRQSASFGRVCRLRPILAAIALGVVFAGIECGQYAFFRYVVAPSNRGFGDIGYQWLVYGAELTQLIIPIALLLWLARRWRGMQTNPAPCR